MEELLVLRQYIEEKNYDRALELVAELLEVYRNPVKSEQIMDCIGKLITLRHNLVKTAKKEKQTPSPSAFLWILTPTISEKILTEFNAISREN